MKYERLDLTNATFMIPIRIESPDRLRNVITVLSFLLENLNTNIILKEVDKESVFQRDALPILRDIVDLDGQDIFQNLNYIFEQSDDPLFHRQKIINEMIMEADTKVVVNYDCDVILRLSAYDRAYHWINDGLFDVVYPFGDDMYQKQVKTDDDLVSAFIKDYDYRMLDEVSKVHTSDYGWVQYFNRQVYIDGGMENENFKAYAPEDKERYYRFKKLGYRVERIDNWVYHLEHARGENSWFTNPHMQSNMDEWEKIQKMSQQELRDYYSNQDYLKKYVNI
tara:strand:- start:30 stop:869 length:840 start_codon:yes stop_codon:yes gene_type:complete